MSTEVQKDKQGLEQLEQFYQKNKNLVIGIGIVVVIALAYVGFRSYQAGQQETKAAPLMAAAQQYFAIDSFNIALYGDGINPGFLEITDKYSASKSGNLSNYYAGVCFLQLKDFPNAIKYLSSFDGDSDMLEARTYELLGHAYAESGDMSAAGKAYDNACSSVDNKYFTPYYLQLSADFKIAQQDYKGAARLFERLKEEYPTSREGQSAERNLAFVNGKLGNS